MVAVEAWLVGAVFVSAVAVSVSAFVGLMTYGHHNKVVSGPRGSLWWRGQREERWQRYGERSARFLLHRAAPISAIACGCFTAALLAVVVLQRI
jgi:hypothetical protein